MTLSVIIPNYNHAKYLSECLDAVLSQSWQPVEIIIVDDASTDRSLEIAEKYREKFPYLTIVAQKENKGPAHAMNIGLNQARGEYVALCASDDRPLPGFFERSMKLFQAYPEAALCTGDFCRFEEDNSERRLLPLTEPKLFSPADFPQISRDYSFYIPSQSTIYKKEILLNLGGFDEGLMSLCDFYMNCRIVFKHPFLYVPEMFTAYRVVSSSYSRKMRKQISRRHQMCKRLMRILSREDKKFRTILNQSGTLAHTGLYMIAYLTYTPRFWGYFIPALRGAFFRKR